MHTRHLVRKGWSAREIAAVKHIIVRAEKRKHPHVVLLEKIGYWIIISLLAVGAIAFSLQLLPLLVLGSLQVVFPIVLLLGSCLGLLLVHVIHDQGPHKTHHHLGFFVLLSVLFFGVTATLQVVSTTFGLGQGWAFVIAGGFALGFAIPYVAHWVMVRESA